MKWYVLFHMLLVGNMLCEDYIEQDFYQKFIGEIKIFSDEIFDESKDTKLSFEEIVTKKGYVIFY
jgi:hypothetical protein